MRYFKCVDCWRIYPETEPQTNPDFKGCKCVCIRFKDKPDTRWTRVKAWLAKYL